MKRLLSLSFFFSISLSMLTAQETLQVVAAASNCTGELSIYTFDGAVFSPYQTVDGDAGNYVFTIPADGHRFYYFGPNPSSLKPVILGAESKVTIQEPCNGQAFKVTNSSINTEYASLKLAINRFGQKAQTINQSYRASLRNPDESVKAGVEAQMAELDAERLHLLDSLKEDNLFLHRILSLNTYLSYPNNGAEKYPNEVLYFAAEFFSQVDWKDEAYNYLPWVFEAFKSYTTTMSQVKLPAAEYQRLSDQALAAITPGSGAHKLALSGIMSILKQKNHGSFAYYGRQYIETFGKDDPAAAASLQKEINQVSAFATGGEAPNFTQLTTEGEELSLHELRGKVLLVDFWASWCGPCRRDNPHVVQMYNHYKDQGFDILSVSLDRTKDRWLQAITADKLEQWHHVSDLKGWQNAVAQLYGVRSIPHTILLDAEGRIIARGLRGQQLEAKLAELFE